MSECGCQSCERAREPASGQSRDQRCRIIVPLSFSKCKGREERAKGSRGYTVIRCGRQWGEKCNDGITATGGATAARRRPGRHCGNNNNNHNRAHKGVTAAVVGHRDDGGIGEQTVRRREAQAAEDLDEDEVET